jgi:hypothetical protein
MELMRELGGKMVHSRVILIMKEAFALVVCCSSLRILAIVAFHRWSSFFFFFIIIIIQMNVKRFISQWLFESRSLHAAST